MLRIDGISDEPFQLHKLAIEGSADLAEMTLIWRETQNFWFMNLTWGSFSVQGIRVCHLPNILTQFANILPFGIAIYSTNGQDPFLLQSFSNGTTALILLNSTEVAEYEAIYG
jgi:hypothetical protein